VEELITWDGTKMVRARGLLKISFYQMHTRYKPIESIINQINTLALYEKVATSNQLRAMLLAIIADQILNQNRLNLARQERFLTLNA
jgi:hypothetical protein